MRVKQWTGGRESGEGGPTESRGRENPSPVVHHHGRSSRLGRPPILHARPRPQLLRLGWWAQGEGLRQWGCQAKQALEMVSLSRLKRPQVPMLVLEQQGVQLVCGGAGG